MCVEQSETDMYRNLKVLRNNTYKKTVKPRPSLVGIELSSNNPA
jgi:hypothetical protein